jgi:hypothetical protein
MGEWLLSRRDRLTVAWHAVSWSLEIRTLGEGHFGVIYAPKVAPGLSPAFQPAHKRWANGLSPGGDGAIVAWHEVPGTAPPKKPPRRVRSDSGMRAHAVSNPIIQSTNSLGHQCGPISDVQATVRPSPKVPTTSSG